MLRNDWWHTVYDKENYSAAMVGGGQGIEHPTRQWLSEYIPDKSSFLDVGCCNALTLECFKSFGKNIKYTGVDQMETFIAKNKSRFPLSKFAVSDASDLRDFTEPFDYTSSRHVIDHLNHYSQHFVELWRLTRKEMIIITWLGLRNDGKDRLQFGMVDEGGSWYNQYDLTTMGDFIYRNLNPASSEFIIDYNGTGNSIIICKKEQV